MTRFTFLLCAGLLCGAALLGFGCPVAPAPIPEPTPTATPEPTPTPEPLCFAPLPGPAGDYVPVETLPSERLETVLELERRIGWQHCWKGNEDAGLEALAAALREWHLCAVKHEDRVLIERTDHLYEEMHAVAYTTGCWTSFPYKGTLAFIGAAE